MREDSKIRVPYIPGNERGGRHDALLLHADKFSPPPTPTCMTCAPSGVTFAIVALQDVT